MSGATTAAAPMRVPSVRIVADQGGRDDLAHSIQDRDIDHLHLCGHRQHSLLVANSSCVTQGSKTSGRLVSGAWLGAGTMKRITPSLDDIQTSRERAAMEAIVKAMRGKMDSLAFDAFLGGPETPMGCAGTSYRLRQEKY